MSAHLILGPMFSGKTTELLRLVRRQIVAGQKCVLVKFDKDLRYSSDHVVSHDQINRMEAVTCGAELMSIIDSLVSYDVIGIDEGQFHTDIVKATRALLMIGKMVIVSALDGTFQRKPFGCILDLVPFCDSAIKLSAVCMACKKADAAFSILNQQKTSDDFGEFRIKIGGAETYSSVCGKCRAQILALNEMKATAEGTIRDNEDIDEF